MSKQFGVILNDVRSCENVGSILRTADFFGFRNVWFVGVTPYPTLGKASEGRPSLDKTPPGGKPLPSQGRDQGPSPQPSPEGEVDTRLPHVREKMDRKIRKVSLGAEENLSLAHFSTLAELITKLKSEGWKVVALEQAPGSVKLSEFKPDADKVVLVLGTERTGLDSSDLSLVDEVIEIPRVGEKESLNVSVAFGVAAAGLVI
jgi:tRNA G18 (ribose-2'-O)-methylase SpoU